MINDIRELDLGRVLGSERNASELRHLLELIQTTDYASSSSRWTAQGQLESFLQVGVSREPIEILIVLG